MEGFIPCDNCRTKALCENRYALLVLEKAFSAMDIEIQKVIKKNARLNCDNFKKEGANT